MRRVRECGSCEIENLMAHCRRGSSLGSLENRIKLRYSQPHDRGREGEPFDLKGNIMLQEGSVGSTSQRGGRGSRAAAADVSRT